jgi:hypothetical protein
MLIVTSEILTDISPNSEFLLNVAAYILFPGFGIAGVFATFLFPFPFDNPSLAYIILSYVFALIFYSLVFWGIVEGIPYARKKYFCSKTN